MFLLIIKEILYLRSQKKKKGNTLRLGLGKGLKQIQMLFHPCYYYGYMICQITTLISTAFRYAFVILYKYFIN